MLKANDAISIGKTEQKILWTKMIKLKDNPPERRGTVFDLADLKKKLGAEVKAIYIEKELGENSFKAGFVIDLVHAIEEPHEVKTTSR